MIRSTFALALVVLIIADDDAFADARSAVSSKRNGSTITGWKQLKTDCERRKCRQLPPGEDENCVLKCQGPPCFDLIYEASPLEPGEVDSVRSVRYQRCLRELETQLRMAKLWPPRLDPDTSSLSLPSGGINTVKLGLMAIPQARDSAASAAGAGAQANGLSGKDEADMLLGGA